MYSNKALCTPGHGKRNDNKIFACQRAVQCIKGLTICLKNK